MLHDDEVRARGIAGMAMLVLTLLAVVAMFKGCA